MQTILFASPLLDDGKGEPYHERNDDQKPWAEAVLTDKQSVSCHLRRVDTGFDRNSLREVGPRISRGSLFGRKRALKCGEYVTYLRPALSVGVVELNVEPALDLFDCDNLVSIATKAKAYRRMIFWDFHGLWISESGLGANVWPTASANSRRGIGAFQSKLA